MIKTESVLIQNLIVPCFNKCRYCLLSWDGSLSGVEWERSIRFAKRFREGIINERPEVSVSFAFGYSMEHPNLLETVGLLKRIGSPQAEFLQCDGMRMRDEKECFKLVSDLKNAGVKHLNFTVYGDEDYHDRFAGRKSDHALIIRMMRAAAEAGLEVSVGIPVTKENIVSINDVINSLTDTLKIDKLSLFVPHEEGRGASLASARLTEGDLTNISQDHAAMFNRNLFRPEREWVTGEFYKEETKRAILISLYPENIDRYESMDPFDLLREIEGLDEAYYAAYPSFSELAELYGDSEGTKIYRQRDLFYHYRKLYAADHSINVYDVTDERFSGSRRY